MYSVKPRVDSRIDLINDTGSVNVDGRPGHRQAENVELR